MDKSQQSEILYFISWGKVPVSECEFLKSVQVCPTPGLVYICANDGSILMREQCNNSTVQGPFLQHRLQLHQQLQRRNQENVRVEKLHLAAASAENLSLSATATSEENYFTVIPIYCPIILLWLNLIIISNNFIHNIH